MRAMICTSRGTNLLPYRFRGATRISVAYFRSARFSTIKTECTDETITLPVGNNGAISLQITRSNALSQRGKGPKHPDVILYLPSGCLFPKIDTGKSQKDEHPELKSGHLTAGDIQPFSYDASPQHVLASTTSAVVVTVNYRLGYAKTPADSLSDTTSGREKPDREPEQTQKSDNTQFQVYRYPTPVHDTLAGFDWIQTHLKPAKLAICGVHIGGSLALMLALTEAQSIQAVAAIEPVCDWPGLDEYCMHENTSRIQEIEDEDNNHTIASKPQQAKTSKPKRQSRKKALAPPDLVPLLQARSKFFSTPERCFDTFASPILFLRSAGRDVPRTFPQYLTGPDYPVPVLKTRITTTADQYSASEGSIWDQDVYPDMDADDIDDIGATVIKRRKALSRWPPYGLDYGISGNTQSGPSHGVGRLEVKLPLVQLFLRDNGSPVSDECLSSSTSEPKKKPKGMPHGSTVLAKQAEEMISVMRRACFWGLEKGVGERRVTLSRLRGADKDAGEEVGDWLKRSFQSSIDNID